MEEDDGFSSGLKVFDISKMSRNARLYKYYWLVAAKRDLPANFKKVNFSYIPVGPCNIPIESWIAVEDKHQYLELCTYIEENFKPLCLFDALKYMAELESENLSYVALSSKFPRLGSVFNPKHRRWIDYKFAPAFDEDSDPVVDGFK